MNPEEEFEFQSNVLPQSSFTFFFQDMREQKEYCDVILRAANLSIPAHSIVIAAAIPYLRNTLSSRGSQKEVDIPEVDDLKPSAIESMIEYAYHGKIKSNAANAMDLLFAACRFQIDEMRIACCSFLADNLNPGNAMCVRDLARQLNCEDLVQTTNRYISENFGEMSKADGFLNCSFTVLKEIIGRDDLIVESEETVYETVMKWTAHTNERQSHLPELVSDVRLPLLKLSYLRLKVSNNELIRNSSLCRNWVDEVTNYLIYPDEVVLSSEFNTQPRRYVSTECAEPQPEEGNEICHSQPPLYDNTENARVNEKTIDGGIQRNCKPPNGVTREQDDQRVVKLHRQQSTASDLQFSDDSGCAAAEDDDPSGIYAIHAKLVFAIQHFEDKTKKWQVKKRDFFTINTASVTGLTDRICFLDCENMCYYNLSDKKLRFTDSYVQGRAVTAVGDTLYVFGGSDGRTIFDSAECFDPESDEWFDLKCMRLCREYASCVALGEYLYIIGGNDFECIHRTVERYDIQNNEWSVVEGNLTARSKLGAASLNGKIYICGGFITLTMQECATTAEVYDPNTNRWILISPLSTARVNFTLLSYAGKLYAVGGYDENDDYVNNTDVYDPRTGLWHLGYPLAPGFQITGAAVM